MNAAALTDWLSSRFATLCEIDEEDGITRMCLWGFSSIYLVVKHKKRWLDDGERQLLEHAREASLHGFNWLSLYHCNRGTAFFAMKPKFHMIDHILRHAVRTGLNPRAYWTLADESFGGEVANVCKGVHPNCIAKRGTERWLVAYFYESSIFK